MTADEDRTVVTAVLAGAVESFAVLVERHQGRILSHLTRLVGRSDAEDLAQDTFVRAYQGLGRYDPLYPFRGWLLVIASRLAANHVARRRESRFAAEAPEPPGPSPDPARTVAERDAHNDLVARLDRALATLPPDAQVLYELRFRQELSVSELAAHFAISDSALKVRVHRLRQTLAERLGISLEEAS
jgi:RNA polymerase sigma-70 factor (ECF subfamily)